VQDPILEERFGNEGERLGAGGSYVEIGCPHAGVDVVKRGYGKAVAIGNVISNPRRYIGEPPFDLKKGSILAGNGLIPLKGL